MAKEPLVVSISMRDLPEVLWEIRHEFAQVLREEAQAEASPHTACRLIEIADAFEAGVGGQEV